MLNVGKIEEGFVLDHIQAGKSMSIYHHLQLDKLDCPVAIIKNARSEKMGKKDIIKIDQVIDLNLDVLGYVNPGITVNVIRGGVSVKHAPLSLPERVEGVIMCKNPRCITTIEQELPQVFRLTDREKGIYRCLYCETKAKRL